MRQKPKCSLAPSLFQIYVKGEIPACLEEKVLRKMRLLGGDDKCLSSLHFADDQW